MAGQKNVQRVDLAGSLRPPRKMPDGRMVCDAYLTRVGVFRYPQKDGSVILELRHPDDVFQRESMDSFAHLPVTNTHPSKMLTTKTARRHMVGATDSRVSRDGDHMAATLMIADADTIAEMESGDKVEVSNGYTCDLEEGPGVDPVYGRWDVRQRNIRGNHVALVERGRAGPTARVRMDESEISVGRYDSSTETALSPAPAEPFGSTIRPIDLHDRDNVSHVRSMSDEALRALNTKNKELQTRIDELDSLSNKETVRADAAEAKLEQANKKVAELESKISANQVAVETQAVAREKERADKAEADLRAYDSKFGPAVRARAKLERIASAVMGPKFRMDDLNDRQVRCEVVKRLDATKDVGEAVSTGKIEGFFESLTDDWFKNAERHAEISAALNRNDAAPKAPVGGDDDDDKPAPSRRDAWKRPLPNSKAAREARGQKGSY